jgi:hypothetical protein
MASASDKKQFRPGEVVPIAGIYSVLHRGHRESHEATLNVGETFPSCKVCEGYVRFELISSAHEGGNNDSGGPTQ